MPVPLLATKLYTPPVRPELVSRPRLIERLDAGLDRKLTIVSAAAGFGKTTLVTEWLSQLDCPSTWLSLDEGDNDPVRFLSYLVAALQKLDERIGQVVQGSLGAPQLPAVESLVTVLINDLASIACPFVLVLDEYDTIHAEAIHEAIEFLIEHQPPPLRLVLVTRQDPPLPLPRLRVRRQVAEICEDDLRFTLDESAAFLCRALGTELDAASVTALDARTEGWIAGLQLAALSLRGRTAHRISDLVNHFSGSHRHVIDYLADEVLNQQTDELRTFLCQTSILQRLSASLCDAVTGRVDSKEVLRQLDQGNLFLIPLDDHREWYRYHRLFADFLRTELDSETEAALHKRAARWLEAQHLLPEAIDHVLASADVGRAAHLISLAAAEALAAGSLVTLQGWLDALPEDVVRGHTDLAIAQSFLLFFGGRTTEALDYAEAAERSIPAGASPSTWGRLLSMKAHLALCADDLDATHRFSREALACLDEEDAVFRNLTLNLLGQALEAKDDVTAAVDVYRQITRRGRGVGNEVGAMVVLTNLVLGLNELGRRTEASGICRQVIEEGASRTPRSLPVAEGMYLSWSLLSYEANELEVARQQVVRALDLAEQASIVDGILWGRFILARVLLACGEFDEARKVIRKGRNGAASHDVYEAKVQWFGALEAQINLVEGYLPAAIRWAEATGYSPSDVPHMWDEFAYLQYVRLLLVQNRLEDAQQLLDAMADSASRGNRNRKLISVCLLQVLLHQKAGQIRQAVAVLQNAVELAAPEGYLRAFLDEDPAILGLLPRVQKMAPSFVTQIVAAASPKGREQVLPRGLKLEEPLTEREQQVLRLIAAGRSNPEIAEHLYLSLNTVKWHVKNLYGKLGVGSRIEAVGRAQELALL